MGLIRVDSHQLKAQAEQLKQLNATFKNTTSDLEASEENLNSMWEGDANDQFHKAFKSDKTQMDNFYNAIEKYVSVLQEMVANYESVEAVNTDTAVQRNY
ncbi:MAG: WXG100 family type VII secretion target [Lachnospira sp.]|nr:WXG100 family type VII secretion target [Lachnospira sp.]